MGETKRQRRLDITGMKSGKLTALTKVDYGIDKDGKRYALWLCKCECGGVKIVNQHSFVAGRIKSCGCIRNRKHYKIIQHGLSRTRIYSIYNNMIQRCTNPKDQHYENYGGRGIKVCSEWSDTGGFISFYTWAIHNGYNKNLTIDRKDVNGNYTPDNCKWSTPDEQSKNKRNNVWYEINGEKLLLKDIVNKYNIPEPTLRARLHAGLTIEEAIKHKKNTRYRK